MKLGLMITLMVQMVFIKARMTMKLKAQKTLVD